MADAQGADAHAVLTALRRVVLGQDSATREAVVALLAGGHVLLEGVPGTAKTLMVRTLACALGVRFTRIQFTPDLMPADITGISVLTGSHEFVFRPGPIFADLILADELNRAPAKTQAALLEAMQERTVTADGTSHALPAPFTVFATQNPIEFEGTYPLPEAELDRFLLKVTFDGEVVGGDHPYNEAGHLIHTAVLKGRPQINVVLHSHTRAGMAVAAMKAGLLPLSQHAMVVIDQVAYHPYQDVTGADDECDLLARDLGSKYLMILQNHGLLACGRTAAEAFYYHYYLEMACKVQVDVMSSGADVVMPPPKAVRPVAEWGEPGEQPRGVREWPALLRLIEAKEPSFRN